MSVEDLKIRINNLPKEDKIYYLRNILEANIKNLESSKRFRENCIKSLEEYPYNNRSGYFKSLKHHIINFDAKTLKELDIRIAELTEEIEYLKELLIFE